MAPKPRNPSLPAEDEPHVGDNPPDDVPQDDPSADPDDQGDDDGDPAGADTLGDPGKRALDAMKARLKAERKARRDAETERDRLKLAGQQDDQAKALETARQEAATAAEQRANLRIIRSEVKAAATGKLSDPTDALTFLDLKQFEVDENGEVDEEDIASAIEDLIRRKPYLAAKASQRFQGTGDNGAAGRKGGPAQVTEAELAKMSPEQIEKARIDGRLKDLLTGKKG